MADNGEDVAQLLASGVATPIAELSPELTESQKRVVRGEVTITWPYNSVNKSLAFLLAEPDVRLRRAKGLIRVQLNGASAEAVAGCNLGGGDEVLLSLDGVGWENDDAPARPAGSRSDWQLKFSNKIILQAKLAETEETKTVNIYHTDAPEPIETAPPVQEEPAVPEPIPEMRMASPPRRVPNAVETGEYPSPAFIKRARVSYGALLETDFDEFEDDGGVRGKGRKKPRFSFGGSRWRYQSATPSPEPEIRASSSPEAEAVEAEVQSPQPQRTQMTDEGCQTVEEELTPLPPMTSTPNVRHGFPPEPSSPLERHAMANIFAPSTDMGVQTQHPGFINHPAAEHGHLMQSTSETYGFGQNAQQPSRTTAIIPKQDEYNVPRFQAAMADPNFGDPEVSMGDQVRFGFSHQSQPVYNQVREETLAHQEHHLDHIPDAYPATYLEHPPATSHLPGDVHGNFGIGDHLRQDHYALEPQQTDQEPLARRKSSGQQELLLWPIDAQTMDYEHAVAHVDVDAPIPAQDGHHAIKEDLRSNGSEPDEETLAENDQESEELRAQAASDQPLYRQGEIEEPALVGPENDLQEEEDDISSEEEADYDEDQVGDDYDMRNYADVEDDEEGFESQEENGPHPDEELIDEDGEGSYDEDEEGSYDEDEEEDEEDDDRGPQRMPLYYAAPSRGPPPPAQSSGPVVIDLISDSEDEDDNKPTAINSRDQYDTPAGIGARVEGHGTSPTATFQPQSQSLPAPNETSHVNADLKEESPSYDVEPESGSEEADEDAEGSGASGQSDQEYDSADGDELEEDEEEAEEDEEIVIVEETRVDMEAELLPSTSSALSTEAEAYAHPVTKDSSEHIIQTSTSPQHFSSQNATISHEETGQQQQDTADVEQDILMADSAQGYADSQVTEHHPEVLQDVAMADGTAMAQQTVQLGLDMAQEVQDASLMIRTYDRAQDDDQVLPSSPPMTQQFASQVISKEDFIPTDFGSSQPTRDDDRDQLPTPSETQLPDNLDSSPPLEEEKVELQVIDEVTTSPEYNLQPPAEVVPGLSDIAEEDMSMVEPTQHVAISEPQYSSESVTLAVIEEHQEATAADMEMTDEIIQSANAKDGQDQQMLNEAPENTDAVDAKQSPPPDEGAIHVSKEKTPVPETQSTTESHDWSEDPKGLTAAPSSVSQKVEDQDAREPVEAVQVQTEGKAEQDGPAAGTRRLRSRAAPPPPVDPSIQLARAAIASKRGKRATEQPPISPRTTRTRSMSFQKSATPEADDNSVQLARAALKSPSKRKHEPLAEQLKSDLYKRLPVEMPDCISLKLLWSHHNKELDVAAVATTKSTDPSRAKGGPRQYIMSFNVTDPSIAPSEVVEVHFFRAHKDFLPIIKPGDAVLLRNFTVTPLKDKGFGLRSHDDSSWAVFDKNDGLAQIRGPPIELNDEEVDYMATLKKWYAALDKAAQSQLEKANQKFAEVNRAK